MKKIVALNLILLFIISCKTQNNIASLNNYDVEVIKFMGSISTQPYSIGEKTFWDSEDEHAKLLIRNNQFIEEVKGLENHSSENFKEYNYAFIVNNKDTLYSDSSLKSWILKENDNLTYFYDEQGVIAEKLRTSYSFFYECW